MKFYTIAPLAHLDLMLEGQSFFCLSQLYKKHEHYRQFFKDRVKAGDFTTIDCGTGDFDTVSMSTHLDMIEDLNPTEAISLDILFDNESTKHNLDIFSNELEKRGLGHISIFYCAQGKNWEEWLDSYQYGLNHPKVRVMGLSKIATVKIIYEDKFQVDVNIKEARQEVYQRLAKMNLIQKELHALGLGDPNELVLYKKDEMFRSNDSCNSIWSGMNGLDWSKGQFERIPTPKDYFDRTMTESQITLAKSNITWFKALLSE